MNQLIKPIDVYSDSQGAIAMTYNPVNRSTTKHIALADHYVCEQQEEGVISVSYVDTQAMIADMYLHKAIGRGGVPAPSPASAW